MARSTVLRRGSLVDTLTVTVERYATKIGEGFRRLTRPHLEPGETPPDVAFVVVLLGRVIASRFRTLLTHDRADFDERAADAAPRREMWELTQALHDKLVALRRAAEVTFTKTYSVLLIPIQGTTATAPRAVYLEGLHTLTRLAEALEDSPQPRLRGLQIDFDEWIEDLTPYVDELGLALGVVEQEKAKASATVEVKKQSMHEFDFLYTHGCAIVRALLFLAGLEKTAEELPFLFRRRRSRRGAEESG